MQRQNNFHRRSGFVLTLFLMILPTIAFYFILWKNAVSFPVQDDYAVILRFINTISVHPGFLPKLVCWLTFEQTGYKLMFANAIAFGQCSLFGQVHFLPLVEVGNAFAFLIFLTVCSMSSVAPGDLGRKAILLVPVSYLLFQPQYYEALDFATASLGALAVIFFSLLSIYLLSRDSLWSFAVGCIALVFAIASGANGFFVIPVGLLILAQFRRWRRMPAWIGVCTLMLAVYLFRYVPASENSLAHFNILFALSFLGSSAALILRYHYMALISSVVLGLILCGIFAMTIKRRYYKQNPAVFYSMLFILITAVAVAGTRSHFGLEASLASRYRIYSNLFLVLSYMFLIENLLPLLKRESLRKGILVGVGALSVAFCIGNDVLNARHLQDKKQFLTYIYRVQWLKDPSAVNDAEVKKQVLGYVWSMQINERPMYPGDFGPAWDIPMPIMQESVRLGLYRPPLTPRAGPFKLYGVVPPADLDRFKLNGVLPQ